MRFRATIEQSGKTATGIPVPEGVVAALGRGKRAPVRVTIGGHTYLGSLASVDGKPMVSLSAENRERAGVAAGDEADVDIEVDTAPRQVTVPADFADALDADGVARQTFDRLSYSNKQWHVLSIEGARTAETRQRRIAKSVSALREGRAR